mmetsp:Transcript_61148/g.144399  ORF Transcript_61148/g.144399 Transcript_61148/m.144399 type:complete len:245 (+) Transcript_61148:219-953(+)
MPEAACSQAARRPLRQQQQAGHQPHRRRQGRGCRQRPEARRHRHRGAVDGQHAQAQGLAMTLGRRHPVQHGHDHRLHRTQRDAQQRRTADQPRSAGQPGVGQEGEHRQHHGRSQRPALVQSVGKTHDRQPHADGRQRKAAKHQADAGRRQPARMTHHRHDEAVRIPARGQHQIDQDQAPERRQAKQLPGRRLTEALCEGLGLALRHTQRQRPGQRRQQRGKREGRRHAGVVDQQAGQHRRQCIR